MTAALECRPDLILLDLEMPGIGGFELCQRLKCDPSTALVPVVFLTGTSDVATKVRGFDLGAVDYITKPFDTAELRARVRAALRTKRYLDLLSVRAQIDGLTGLYNRAYFDQRLAEEVSAASRYGRRVSLLLVDLDHFKRVNDTFGHPFGDLVLQRTGETLQASLRTTDAACRYGGEEFAIVMTETSLQSASLAAERIRLRIAAMALAPKGVPYQVTASLGVASTDSLEPGPHMTPAALLEAADDALYEAKFGGRNRVCLAEKARARRPLSPGVRLSSAPPPPLEEG
jgi:two-component system, cell cycle response regulator